MTPRIMVPLDGSKAGELVLDSATQLAQAFGAELLLRRVVQPVPLPADPILPVTSRTTPTSPSSSWAARTSIWHAWPSDWPEPGFG